MKNCAGCHGVEGRGGIAPEIGNPVFQQAASDAFIIQTIRRGREHTPMPAFQAPAAPVLSDQDLADLLAFLRTFAPARDKAVAKVSNPPTISGGQP